MDRILERDSVVARCGRCQAPILEPGLCPACLLREGLDFPSDPLAGPLSFVPPASKEPGRFPEDAPLVDGYRLLAELGRGGMGVVYLAEQIRPLRRRVALKLIKLGMDTKQVIARFEAERQALAIMDHPGVAKVLGAGATHTGRPYFIMELVRGPRITDYCDQYQLSARERLALFLQVCHAIQHAHQKGIIHRDIKPSNILVTQQDGAAVPKVIDFGIAKATGGQPLTDKTIFTGVEQILGTPAYTSPEQAEGGGDLDTRTDIYSLGVLLYELLTGQTPFDLQELFRSGWEMMRRTIRETEPQRPSTRLTTMAAEELRLVARRRRAEPPKLIHAVRGDLDWIAMKCLEKDRSRRYEHCSAIASDIERHLHSQPVTARPPSRGYRLKKLVYRNKTTLSFGAVVATALAISLGLAAWSIHKQRKAEDVLGFFDKTQVHRTILPRNKPLQMAALSDASAWDGGEQRSPPTLQSAIENLHLPGNMLRSSHRVATTNGADPGGASTPRMTIPATRPGPRPEPDAAYVSETTESPANPVVAPSSMGSTFGQWAALWWQWLMELPMTNANGAVHPLVNSPFFDATMGQKGQAWFLASPFGTVRRSFVMPPDTWIFLGLLNVESSSVEGGTEFFGATAAEQAEIAGFYAGHIVGLFCEIDGVPVPDLGSYRVRSPQITFTAPTPWIYGEIGGRGTSVGDGYFMLLSPLGSGQHTIHYGGSFLFRSPPDLVNLYYPMEVTYFVSVP